MSDYKNWLIDVKKSNPELSIKIIAEVLDRTAKEIEGFLYSNRNPSFEDMFRLSVFCRESKLKMPTEMDRHLYDIRSKCLYVAKKYFDVYRDRSNGRSKKYIVNGELKTLLEITGDRKVAERFRHTLYRNGIISGEDITVFVNEYVLNKKTRQCEKFLYNDEYLTITEIAAKSDYKAPYLSKLLKNFPENSDITEFLSSRKRNNRRQKNGE